MLGKELGNGSRWKVLPSTAARTRTARSSMSSRSMRAASSAWIVGGTAAYRLRLLRDRRAAARGRAGSPRPLRRCGELRLRHPTSCRERLDESRGLCLAQRLERDDSRPPPGRRPGRTVVEELRPGHTEQQNRLVGREREEVLEQVEERRLRPLKLVHDRDQGALPGERLEELAERPERLLGRSRRLGRPDRAEDPLGYERRVLVVAKDVPDDALAAQSLDDLRQRPVCDAFAVR